MRHFAYRGIVLWHPAGPAPVSVPGRFGDKDAAAETSGVPSTRPSE